MLLGRYHLKIKHFWRLNKLWWKTVIIRNWAAHNAKLQRLKIQVMETTNLCYKFMTLYDNIFAYSRILI